MQADETAYGQLTDVLGQLNAIIQRLPAAEDSVAAYQQRVDRYLALGDLAEALSWMHESLQMAYMELESAAAIVDQDRPVDIAYGTGRSWAGPQPPCYLLGLADRAADGTARATTSYRARLSDTRLTESMDPACPKIMDGRPCSGTRVNRADGTRAAACWPHLTAEQKSEINAERKKAIAANACAECGVAAGEKCIQDGRTTTVHQRRLRALHQPGS
ncbi:hypothetical protein [Geodermatophilus sp. CPCC 205506]|uniref:hypothetical protein n=1 Tax=Geodermatophilus sp. CPCC 205506 TaxID=2936596 RepID=UPI003EEA8E0D